jgi:hypothetical protein
MPEGRWLWPARLALAVLALGLVGLLSDLPQGSPSRAGLLRLAWRTVGEQVQLCRQRSAEELSRVAPHMRQPLECRQRTLPYRLEVRVDDAPRIAHPVRSVGARGDRPLFVQEELPLEPGAHALEIAFGPAPELAVGSEGIATASAAQREALQRALAGAERYRETFQVLSRPGRIILVELDEAGRRFRVTGG